MRRLAAAGLFAALGLVVGLSVAVGEEKEEKIPVDKVPKAVLNAVKARFAGAEITGAEKEEDDGKTFYELAVTHKGQTMDVLAEADGKIVEVERLIKESELPGPVAAGVKAKYPDAKVKKAEELTKGSETSYEVIIETGARKERELTLDPGGKILEDDEVGED